MELPKLKAISENQIKRPKILLLSDDINSTSGIGTMSRTFVCGTADKFNWVQLAAALNHPENGKIVDISEHINKETGLTDSSVKLYLNTGYGNPDILRRILDIEKPDAILHFTDPRFWDWLYSMEHEIHQHYKIPLMYYAIWDNYPYPYWNRSAYESCDLIMAISKQSHLIHKQVLNQFDVKTVEVDAIAPPPHDHTEELKTGDVLVKYVPHGIDSKLFYPIDENSKDYEDYKKFENEFRSKNNSDFVIFWTNRNIRRKQPGDMLLAYKIFCDSLTKEQAEKCVLLLHTSPVDENGTDLFAVKKAICPNYKVIFSVNKLPPQTLNFFYNIADVTLNIASNEGFGLSSAESMMAGTMIINNVTGGLQDQMMFIEDDFSTYTPSLEFPSNHNGRLKNCGSWAIPIFPSNRSLQGSIPTPFIYDDRCDPEDVSDAFHKVYNYSREERKKIGMEGRHWALGEGNFSADKMSDNIADAMSKCINNFKSKEAIQLIEVGTTKPIIESGVILNIK